jgi:valyl-tRNA synthetase
MQVHNPLVANTSLPVIVFNEIKSTFGTGINTVTPAHDIEDLRISYAHKLSREGVICPETGNLQFDLGMDRALKPRGDGVKIAEAVKRKLGKNLIASW